MARVEKRLFFLKKTLEAEKMTIFDVGNRENVVFFTNGSFRGAGDLGIDLEESKLNFLLGYGVESGQNLDF